MKRFSDRINLRFALLLYIIAPLTVVVLLAGYLAIDVIESRVETRMQKDLELVARAIQLPLSHALERDREGSIVRALESAFSIGRVYSAYVYDDEGHQIASAGRADPEPERRKFTELAADGQRQGEYGRVGDRGVYSYFIPLTDTGGRVAGLLHLTRRESDFRQDLRTIRRQGLFGLGIGLLSISGMVLFGHHQALGRHIRRLNAGMAKIAGGRREHRLQADGPKEMVEVFDSFNRMLDSIQAAQDTLRHKQRQQKALEDQLRHSEKLAAIGQLAAGVAHELGTPLSVISGQAQRALRSSELPPRLTANLEQIRREVDKLTYIVRQLLQFSHRSPLQLKALQPGQVARSAAAAVGEEAAAAQVALEMAVDEPLPTLHADPVRLEQALVNLLRNAIQATPATRVRLACMHRNGRMVFEVADNGPGIPAHQSKRLFEPFFTTKTVGSGTGLGLAVVHGIVQEHGGRIEVGRGDGNGACFRILLPLTAEKQE